jgi:CBS domain containing-hemolysin-like protein
MLEWSLVHVSLIAFFILANSFFVAAEFALVSVRETRIEQLIALDRPGRERRFVSNTISTRFCQLYSSG